jgi:hypothetical protein
MTDSFIRFLPTVAVSAILARSFHSFTDDDGRVSNIFLMTTGKKKENFDRI